MFATARSDIVTLLRISWICPIARHLAARHALYVLELLSSEMDDIMRFIAHFPDHPFLESTRVLSIVHFGLEYEQISEIRWIIQDFIPRYGHRITVYVGPRAYLLQQNLDEKIQRICVLVNCWMLHVYRIDFARCYEVIIRPSATTSLDDGESGFPDEHGLCPKSNSATTLSSFEFCLPNAERLCV